MSLPHIRFTSGSTIDVTGLEPRIPKRMWLLRERALTATIISDVACPGYPAGHEFLVWGEVLVTLHPGGNIVTNFVPNPANVQIQPTKQSQWHKVQPGEAALDSHIFYGMESHESQDAPSRQPV